MRLARRKIKRRRKCGLEGCNNFFVCETSNKRRFCSNKCKYVYLGNLLRYPKETRVCAAFPLCTGIFEVLAKSPKRYCNHGCNRLGKPGWSRGLTKETSKGLAAMSVKAAGRKQTKEANEKRSKALKGKSYVELHGEEKALDILRRKSLAVKGPKNKGWKGGSSVIPYTFEFVRERNKIKTRDEYRCQLCGKSEEDEKLQTGKGLCIHHVDYNKKNNRHDNLITLCNSCNGVVNAHCESWQRFFKAKLESLVA